MTLNGVNIFFFFFFFQGTEWTYEQLAVNLLDFKDSKALLDQ